MVFDENRNCHRVKFPLGYVNELFWINKIKIIVIAIFLYQKAVTPVETNNFHWKDIHTKIIAIAKKIILNA